MDKFISRITDFFIRAVAPSSFFITILYFNDLFFNDSKYFCSFINLALTLTEIDNLLLYSVLIFSILSYGYINQLFSQFIDEFIKHNYYFIDKDFESLRSLVEKNLTTQQREILPVYKYYATILHDK